MTPLAIETLLKIHCQPCAELNKVGIKQCDNLIEPDPRQGPKLPDGKRYHGFWLTNRGEAMVAALIELPLPTLRASWWIHYSREVEAKL